MRANFNQYFTATHPLRQLAKSIAVYSCHQARHDCFFSAAPPPYDFLANGETNYKPLNTIHCPLDIAQWKFPGRRINCCLERGFNDADTLSCRGLSMLFDPLVDAVLAANTGIYSGAFRKPLAVTVIVFSDYGAIYDSEINVIGFHGNDWGEDEARTILNPINRHQAGTALARLWDCLCGKAWESNPSLIEKTLCQDKILLWNLMPFMRGGCGSSSDAELPDRKCPDWLQRCLEWLDEFVARNSINSTKVVFCVNKARMIPIPSQGHIPVTPATWSKHMPQAVPKKLQDLLNRGEVYVLNHPASWHGKKANNGAALKEIVLGQVSKGNTLASFDGDD